MDSTRIVLNSKYGDKSRSPWPAGMSRGDCGAGRLGIGQAGQVEHHVVVARAGPRQALVAVCAVRVSRPGQIGRCQGTVNDAGSVVNTLSGGSRRSACGGRLAG